MAVGDTARLPPHICFPTPPLENDRTAGTAKTV